MFMSHHRIIVRVSHVAISKKTVKKCYFYYYITVCNNKPVEVMIYGSSPDKGLRNFLSKEASTKKGCLLCLVQQSTEENVFRAADQSKTLSRKHQMLGISCIL